MIRAPIRFILLEQDVIAKIPSAVEIIKIKIPRKFEKIVTNKRMIAIVRIERRE